MPVSDRTRDDYRGLIAAIFPDFHLFHKLYGIPDPDLAEVDRMLAEFKLLDKTRIVGDEFSTVDLSSGQRRRLALIVAGWKIVQFCCWTNGPPTRIRNSAANSTSNSCPR